MSEPLPLFTFGTLMDVDVLALVTDAPIEALERSRATVRDRVRRWVVDDHYPVLMPEAGGVTQGLLIAGLDGTALERVVFFEGEEFALEPIAVEVDGAEVRARHFAHLARKPVSELDWTLEDWQRHTKPDTLHRVKRYMALFGRLTPAEADAYW